MPRGRATLEGKRRPSQTQALRDKRQQGGVGPAVDGRRSKANLQRVAVQASYFTALGSRLGMYGQGDYPVGFAQPVAHESEKNQQQLREDDGDQRRQVNATDWRYDALDRSQHGPGELRDRLAQGRVGVDP